MDVWPRNVSKTSALSKRILIRGHPSAVIKKTCIKHLPVGLLKPLTDTFSIATPLLLRDMLMIN